MLDVANSYYHAQEPTVMVLSFDEDVAPTAVAFYDALDPSATYDGKDLPNMYTPTCIIWGKNDTVTPPEVAEVFHELLSDSDLYWIDKCGHAAMMEHPDEFNRILIKWLQDRGY